MFEPANGAGPFIVRPLQFATTALAGMPEAGAGGNRLVDFASSRFGCVFCGGVPIPHLRLGRNCQCLHLALKTRPSLHWSSSVASMLDKQPQREGGNCDANPREGQFMKTIVP